MHMRDITAPPECWFILKGTATPYKTYRQQNRCKKAICSSAESMPPVLQSALFPTSQQLTAPRTCRTEAPALLPGCRMRYLLMASVLVPLNPFSPSRGEGQDEGWASTKLNWLNHIPSPWPSPARGRGDAALIITGGFHVPAPCDPAVTTCNKMLIPLARYFSGTAMCWHIFNA